MLSPVLLGRELMAFYCEHPVVAYCRAGCCSIELLPASLLNARNKSGRSHLAELDT